VIEQRLRELAGISEPGPGVTRPAFGVREREAHALVARWAQEEGARVETDAAGNTVLVYREGDPYLLVGSHLDTVPAGGRYDGTVGVVAGMEVARDLAGLLTLGLRVVAFSAEEGARFGRPCLGSELATGAGDRAHLDLRDGDGATAAEVAEATGLDPGAMAPWLRAPEVAAYLEVHIEQGRVLEREQVRLGVVDVIAGAARMEVVLHGEAAHSGTTPMDDRTDALAAAAELVLAVEDVGRVGRHGVATIGRLDVAPNSATTIPGVVRAVVDVRDVDPERQRASVHSVRALVERIAAGRHVRAEIRELADRDPVMLSAWPRRALADACTELGLPFRILASGAGHDAAVVAHVAPAALLFVPSPGGRSHVPDEECRIDDVAAACAVLATALCRLDHDTRGGG
jgi:allantoate deiminase